MHALGRYADPVPFAASSRSTVLAAMAAEPLDVLVIGGGITGVGVALDAAARGLRVGIVERDDWACGTSSRSSKMIHGGLRYLATGDVGVVRESLRERVRLQRNAAHLVRPLPMLLPTYGRGPYPLQRMRLGLGMWMYDALGHHRAAGSLHRWLDAAELSRIIPGVAPRGGGSVPLAGAHSYHDASADDARLVMSVLRTAVAAGAMAVNGAPVLRLLRDGTRVVGAHVGGDAAAGGLDVEARVVVNAAGVWSDEILRVGGGGEDQLVGFRVLPSKGIHLMVHRDRVGVHSGIVFFGQTSNANVFIEPWQDDLAIVGTTDTRYAGDLASPHASTDDIAWLLGRINEFLRVPLTEHDVIASWAGLRPLVAPEDEGSKRSQDVSRRHLLLENPGCITITGGKLTAYRAMAELAVDAAATQLGVRIASRTRNLALDGCRALPTDGEITELAATLGVSRGDARHLLRRHGANVPHLLTMVDRDRALGERLHPDRPYLAVEAAWACSHEQARVVDDVLERRTRISLETRMPQLAADAVQAVLGASLQR